jgi:histidinol phosphatase-like enzyme
VPAAPTPAPAKATPAIEPLPGIRAVTWSIYGTLLSIPDGQLLHLHPQPIRMQVALEKTIQEFNMWNSMTRKAGAPWEYLLPKYKNAVEELRMVSSGRKGDFPEIDSARVWRKLLGLLEQKDYQYDAAFYGDMDELSEKVAFFFHMSLQGVAAGPQAALALQAVAEGGLRQGLLADGQCFTVVQLLRALDKQSKLPPLSQLFAPGCLTLSFAEEVRKPSPTLYQRSLQAFGELGIKPGEILHVGSRLADDLAVAKRLGFRTALYAGDKLSLQATSAEVRDPALRPDRLLTDLAQIRRVLALE